MNRGGYRPWGRKELDTIKRLIHTVMVIEEVVVGMGCVCVCVCVELKGLMGSLLSFWSIFFQSYLNHNLSHSLCLVFPGSTVLRPGCPLMALFKKHKCHLLEIFIQ